MGTTPRVDFYILADHTSQGRLQLACRLAEKAYSHRHRVYLHAADTSQADQLDELLWTFRQNSFVPHARYPQAKPEDSSPVLIGTDCPPNELIGREVLINLAVTVPAFFAEFQRVIEVVDQQEAVLRDSRQRFRHYRDAGCTPNSHRL